MKFWATALIVNYSVTRAKLTLTDIRLAKSKTLSAARSLAHLQQSL